MNKVRGYPGQTGFFEYSKTHFFIHLTVKRYDGNLRNVFKFILYGMGWNNSNSLIADAGKENGAYFVRRIQDVRAKAVILTFFDEIIVKFIFFIKNNNSSRGKIGNKNFF